MSAFDLERFAREAEGADDDRESCANCGERFATPGSELCESCAATVDWPRAGRELPAGAELEPSVRVAGGGIGREGDTGGRYATDCSRGEC